MPTVIRLKRGGRTHAPYYRLVVVDSRAKITGRVIEELGYYHPCARPEPKIEVKAERALAWLALGAQPSDTVRSLLKRKGIWAQHTGNAPAPIQAEPEAASEATSETASDAPSDAPSETPSETPAE